MSASRIDLAEIEAKGGFAFERFAESLLGSLGWRIVLGAGKGPDGGRDIVAAKAETSATGRIRERQFVVQCKHYARTGKSVGADRIADLSLMPAKHNCEGWLLITSTQITDDAVRTIEAARRTSAAHEFDYWDGERLRELLLQDPCRAVFRQYLPGSYARCANILIPHPTEIREIAASWLSSGKGRGERFSLDFDFDESLLALAAAKNHSVADLTELVSDERLSAEFLEIWQQNLARGGEKAPMILALDGLRRLRRLRRKGLSESARAQILHAEVTMMSEHRAMKRRYWRNFVVSNGCSTEWARIQATPENAYLPNLELFGAALIFYCQEPGEAAAGWIRVDDSEPQRFIAAFSVESHLKLNMRFVPPLKFEYKLEEGSDPVRIAGVGFSDFPGRWNFLA